MTRLSIALICALMLGTSLHAQTWTKAGSGSNSLFAYGDISTLCSDNYGNIYVAGFVRLIPTTTPTYDTNSYDTPIYKWDGTTWSDLGSPYPGSIGLDRPISTICADASGNIYAAAYRVDIISGEPTEMYHVNMWDGTSWTQLGGTEGGARYAAGGIAKIAVDKYNNVYAVGGFYSDTSYSSGYVAKWDGTSWSEVGTGANALHANSNMDDIIVDTAGNIYVAGAFSDGPFIHDSGIGNTGNLYVAKWDGTSWSELGSGVMPVNHDFDFEIYSLVQDTAGNIYAAGALADSISGFYIAKWDGVTWSHLGGFNNLVFSMTKDIHGNVYAAGAFNDTSITSTIFSYEHPQYVAKLNSTGLGWDKVGTGSGGINANDPIASVCTDSYGNLYAGGEFTDTSYTYNVLDSYTIASVLTFDTLHGHPHYVAKYGSATTGITSVHKSAAIDVYPNPAHDALTITSSSNITSVSINDVVGKSVYVHAYNANRVVVDVSELPIGTYLIKVNDTEVRKFVKE